MRTEFLPYCRPSIDDADIRAVGESMRNGWLTTGPKVREFEARFAEASGVKHAVAISSCTAGLQLGMIACGVGPGDEVIMPSLTFVAGANCARELGAVPIFADVDPATFCITPATIAPLITPRTKMIMPMHYGGYPANVDEIASLARLHDIAVFEDAAHSTGMLNAGRWAGSVSHGAAYSFYATKNLATGEGGMLLTNRDDVAETARIYALHGMDRDAWKRYTAGGSWQYDVTVFGYKYNMPDMAAALGITQLAKLGKMQDRRDEIAAAFTRAFTELDGITTVTPPLGDGDRHAWCMYVIRVDRERAGISRDDFIRFLNERKIGTSVHYIPTHTFSVYSDHVGGDRLQQTDRLAAEIVSLPLYPEMTDADVSDVIQAVSEATAREAAGTLA